MLLAPVLSICQVIPDHDERLKHSYNSEVMIDLGEFADIQRRPFQNSKIAVAAAVAGGGYRATFFTLGVMLELENMNISHRIGQSICPEDTLIGYRYPSLFRSSNWLNEIDYFSTVSGGGFAVGFYLSGLKFPESLEIDRRSLMRDSFCFPQARDTLKEILNVGDANSRFLFSNSFNLLQLRSGPVLRQALKYTYIREESENRKYGKKIVHTTSFAPKLYKGNSTTLIMHLITKPKMCSENRFRHFFLLDEILNSSHLFPRKSEEVRLPCLVANATIVGNVLPFRFTPNIFGNFKVIGDTFTLEQALIASASFPGFFANRVIKCQRGMGKEPSYIHLMDGGVFDNSGIRTAIELLNLDKSPIRYLFVIDARGTDIPSSYTQLKQDFNLTSVVDLVTDLQYLLVDTLISQSKCKSVVFNLKGILNEKDRNSAFHNTLKYRYREMADTLARKFGFKEGWYPDEKIDNTLFAYASEGHRDYADARDNLRYIYEICSNIKTNLSLEEWEKRILILAGKIVVRKNKKTIESQFPEFQTSD